MDISEIQKKELKILLDVKNFCDKNDIDYFLMYGTLLGAVRHKGFIPWDDDIDICMTREDYMKFKKSYKSESFKIHDYDTVQEYPYILPKVVDDSVHYKEKSISHLDYYSGAFIDIFILDGISNNIIIRKIDTFLVYILYGIHRFYFTNQNRIFSKIKKVIPIFCILKSYNNWYSKYNLSSSIYCRFSQDVYNRHYMKTNLFNRLKVLSFEGHQVKVPFDYDEILSFWYGDYMKLPPIEEQIPHHNILE